MRFGRVALGASAAVAVAASAASGGAAVRADGAWTSFDGRAPRLAAEPSRPRPHARVALSDGRHAFVGAPSWSPRTQMLYDAGVTQFKGATRLVGTWR